MKKFLLGFKICFFSLFLSHTTVSFAQSAGDMWLSMPDSIVPYLSSSHRGAMMISYLGGSREGVDNMLSETSKIDTLTADYLSVSLSSASRMEIRRLYSNDGDSVFCVVRTFSGPLSESEGGIYTHEWEPIKPLEVRSDHLDAWIVRPDTMSQERFEQLREKIKTVLFCYKLSAESDDLEVSLSVPLLFKGEQEEIGSLLRPRRFRWNGKDYND